MRKFITSFILVMFSLTGYTQKFLTRTGQVQISILQDKPSYNVLLKNNEVAVVIDTSTGQSIVRTYVMSFELDREAIFITEEQKAKWENSSLLDALRYDLLMHAESFKLIICGKDVMGSKECKNPTIILAADNLQYNKSTNTLSGIWDITINGVSKSYPANIGAKFINGSLFINGRFIINTLNHNATTGSFKQSPIKVNKLIELTLNAELKSK